MSRQRNGKHQAPSSAWITLPRRRAIYTRDDWRCVYCARDLRDVDAQERTLDHIISLAEYIVAAMEWKVWFGSRHKTSNLATACKGCNAARQDSDAFLFARRYGDDAVERLNIIVSDTRRLDIAQAKRELAAIKAAKGEKFIHRKTYRLPASTRQRLSQGVGTIG